jgi:tRNA A-37 threonylcarbamoyl transferase component Bud32
VAVIAEPLPDRYRSAKLIAHGGMGEVYVATDQSLGRDVAVKVLAEGYSRDEALRARFTREALAAAKLSGEANTVTIFDVGEWNGRPYIVMELASGGTVGERARGSVDPPAALRWIEQAGGALDAAHSHGIVHRDVKPANLLLAGDDTIRVADFGIASAAGLTSLTETGTVLGTMGYLAPEQAAGGQVGPAADRYALAVVAYELLAGRRPHEGRGSGTAEAIAATQEPVPPISHLRPGLPPGLDAVFERALHRDPGQRYSSCSAFAGDLRRAFEDAAGATRAHPLATPPPAYRRTRNPWPAVALVLLALGGAGLASALLLGRGDGEPRVAPKPVVKTVTAQGETVTVTTPAPPTTTAQTTATTETTAPTTTASATPVAPASGSELNDAGYELMKAGDYAGALPQFEQAVQSLAGTGSIAEAYALYNLAFTRLALGSCDGVFDLLDRSELIQGERTEIKGLRKDASKSCGGRGKGKRGDD